MEFSVSYFNRRARVELERRLEQEVSRIRQGLIDRFIEEYRAELLRIAAHHSIKVDTTYGVSGSRIDVRIIIDD